MSTPIAPRARLELAAYRIAANLFRGVLALRLALSGDEGRKRRLRERLGRWDGRVSPAPTVWVHAASLGEVLTVAPLLVRLKDSSKDVRIVLTCHTPTGRAAAEQTPADEVRYFPIDVASAVTALLGRVRPRLFLFVETEIWPSLLLQLDAAGVPSVMLNATVSERSFARYGRVRSVISAALGTVALVCARDAVAQDRLIALGARKDRAFVVGDLKSDLLEDDLLATIPDLLAETRAPVLVAASTHEGEDAVVLKAFQRVRSRYPRARLVLAPRHPERAASVLGAAKDLGFAVSLRSSAAPPGHWDVLVVDTTGELRGFMRSAAGVFVGGSLVEIGGHNLFEPAAFGRPLATGPRLEGVREQAEALVRADALHVIHDADELAACWLRWLSDPSSALSAGNRARSVVRDSGGALARTLELLGPLLDEVRASRFVRGAA